MPVNGRKKLADQELIARARQGINASRKYLEEFWEQMDEFQNRQTEFDKRCHDTVATIEKCSSRAEAALKRFSNSPGKV